MSKSIIPEVKVKEGSDVLENPVVFVSEARGLAVFDGDEREPFCRFTPFSVLHPIYGQITKGHFLCSSKKVFDKLIAHPAMDKAYRIVKRLPRETDKNGSVIDREPSGGGRSLAELNEEERALYRELLRKEAQYFTVESNYTEFKDNVRNEETKERINRELSAIRQKLNIKRD